MPYVASSFTPVFFKNAFDSQHSNQEETQSTTGLTVGTRYWPSKHGNLTSFKFSETFPQFEKEYRQALANLRFLSKKWDLGCEKGFQQLEFRLFDKPSYFGNMIDTLYGMGKEAVDDIARLMNSDKIPLHVKKDVLSKLSQGVTVCSEGTVTNLLVAARELALADGGLSEHLQNAKEKTIEQLIATFVRHQHNPKPIYEIHYVNAYMNALANEFGLREIKDRYISDVGVDAEDINLAYQHVQHELTPKKVIETLLQPTLDEIYASLQSYKNVQGNEGELISWEHFAEKLFPQDESTSLHKKVESALASINNRFGVQVDGDDVIRQSDIFKIEEEGVTLRNNSTLAILSAMRALESQGWLAKTPESPVEGQLGHKKMGQECIYQKGELFYLLTKDQDRRLVTTQDVCDAFDANTLKRTTDAQSMSDLVREAIGNTRSIKDLIKLPPEFLAHSDQWQAFFDRLNGSQTLAYIERHSDALSDLIRNSSDNKLSKGLMTWALMGNHTPWVERLLQLGVAPDTRLAEQKTPLMLAAEQGETALANVLMNYGANVRLADKEGRTAAMLAAQRGRADILDVLLTNDEQSIESRDKFDFTPLMHAAAEGQIASIKVLLRHRALVDSSISISRVLSPLMLAAEHGHVQAVKLLLKQRASKDRLDPQGNTPLMLAAGRGHIDVAETLLNAGADIESEVQPMGYTPLMKAASKGQVSMVAFLISKGADVNTLAWDKGSALMRAAKQNQAEVVRLLLENKASLGAEDREGRTSLMIAAENGSVEAARVLLQAGAKPDHRGLTKKWHPITLAAKKGHFEIVKLLVEYGADISVKTNLHNAEYFARKNGHEDIANYLAACKASKKSSDSAVVNTAPVAPAHHFNPYQRVYP